MAKNEFQMGKWRQKKKFNKWMEQGIHTVFERDMKYVRLLVEMANKIVK